MQPIFTTEAYPKQSWAIQTTEGSLLLIAGLGSGKTSTLIERIVFLITQKGIPSESMLVALYQKQLEKDKVSYFSTTQLKALNLLQNHLNVRVDLQQKFIYLIVDNHQDTNTILDCYNPPRRKHGSGVVFLMPQQ